MNAVVSHVANWYGLVDEKVSFVETLIATTHKGHQTRGNANTRGHQFLSIERVPIPCLKQHHRSNVKQDADHKGLGQAEHGPQLWSMPCTMPSKDACP